MSKVPPSSRHQLLVYSRGRYRALALPALVLAAVALAIYFLGPEQLWHGFGYEFFKYNLGDGALPWLITGVACAILWLLVTLATRTAYVQARPDAVVIGTPLWPIRIPYKHINVVRSVSFGQAFPPDKAKRADRGWLRRCQNETAVALDLLSLPKGSRRRFSAFLGPYVFSLENKQLVFLVKDWMALSGELDRFRAQAMDAAKDAGAGKRDVADNVFGRLSSRK